MAHDISHDNTITYQLPPSATGEHHTYSELAPRLELPEPEPAPVMMTPEVQLALAGLIRDVRLWEAAGLAEDVDHYIFGFTPGPASLVEWTVPDNTGRISDHATGGVPGEYEPGHNKFANWPLANLGKHSEQSKAVGLGAATLLLGGAA